MKAAEISELRKPTEFLRTHRRGLPLKTIAALRYHLDRRRENGLLACGAVVESPLGLLIYPPLFEKWILGERPKEGGGGTGA